MADMSTMWEVFLNGAGLAVGVVALLMIGFCALAGLVAGYSRLADAAEEAEHASASVVPEAMLHLMLPF